MDSAEALDRISDLTNVSRETSEELVQFAELLKKWNQKINLVSPSTVPQLWERHILDSAQLLPLIDPTTTRLTDIGSGGGFPGLVISLLSKTALPELQVTMIESDLRKCAFLQTASSTFALKTKVLSKRIENVPPQSSDALTSRALAPLTTLLDFADLHLSQDGTAYFMKGANADAEIEEALASWEFDLQKRGSITHEDAVILIIRNVRRR